LRNRPKPDRPALFLVGLGPGPVDLLTLKAWELIVSGDPLMVSDAGHEAVQTAGARGISFQEVTGSDPPAIASKIIEWASGSERPCVYAVAGHPLEAPEAISILSLAEEAGIDVEVVPALSDVDRLPASDPVTRAHVSPQAFKAALAFMRLFQVMARLRGPLGCPWDREQTHASLAVHLLEETHEALDAIDRSDLVALEEELGDLLLQVVFHSELAREAGGFDASDVVEEILAKLFYRHPHVFGDLVVSGADEVLANWEVLKQREKGGSRLDEIPRTLPALLYAYKVQRRGGDDPAPEDSEGLGDLYRALMSNGGSPEEAIGELLFGMVALSRRIGVDPEGALRRRAGREPAPVD
jgi:tetrapyrrole methylase family protein/MazG family protein